MRYTGCRSRSPDRRLQSRTAPPNSRPVFLDIGVLALIPALDKACVAYCFTAEFIVVEPGIDTPGHCSSLMYDSKQVGRDHEHRHQYGYGLLGMTFQGRVHFIALARRCLS